MSVFHLIFCTLLLGFVQSKPVQEALPHSRDYYAGYIKAITDNFEQLFAGERQVRSTSEGDEQVSDASFTQEENERFKKALEKPESIEDVRRYDGTESLNEMKRANIENKDTKPKVEATSSTSKTNTSATTDEKKATAVGKVEADKKNVQDIATAPTSVQPDAMMGKLSDTGNAVIKVDANGVSSDALNEMTATVKDATSAPEESTTIPAAATTNSFVPEMEQQQITEGTEQQEEPGTEEADETGEAGDTEEPVDFPGNMLTDGADEDSRRDFVLEHANMKNGPIFPNIMSGYQDSEEDEERSPYGGGMATYEGNMFPGMPGPMNFAGPVPGRTPFGSFSQLMPFSPMTDDQSDLSFPGETRSGIDDYTEDGMKRSPQGDSDEADPHHLHRILYMPHDCHGVHNCGHHNIHGCGHHDCGHVDIHHDCGCGHHLVHGIHHLPANCHGYDLHQSPCHTHDAHIGFGYPHVYNAGHHDHHPVHLHPISQEVHHQNVHVVDGCHHVHQDHCGCPNGHGAQGHDDYHYQHNLGCIQPVAVHHHHGHDYHHGHNHHIDILPQYGDTCAGRHGYNPYWGH